MGYLLGYLAIGLFLAGILIDPEEPDAAGFACAIVVLGRPFFASVPVPRFGSFGRYN